MTVPWSDDIGSEFEPIDWSSEYQSPEFDRPPEWAVPDWSSEDTEIDRLARYDFAFTPVDDLIGDIDRDEYADFLGLDPDLINTGGEPPPDGYTSRGQFGSLVDVSEYLGDIWYLDYVVIETEYGYEIWIDDDSP